MLKQSMQRVVAAWIAIVSGCASGGDVDDLRPDPSDIVALEIRPAEPVLTVTEAGTETLDFEVVATFASGDERAIDATWSVEHARYGSIDATGLFVPSGFFAGETSIVARYEDTTVATSLTVRISRVEIGEGVPDDAADRFDPDPVVDDPQSPTVLYPLDRAVIPASLKPPHVQWEGGEAGDLYRVTVAAGSASATAYLAHGGEAFDYAWPLDDFSWEVIKRSALEAPLTFFVDRWVSATSETVRSATHTLEVAEANLDGAIYYWDLTDGKVLRITQEGREDFMPNPPAQSGTENRCVACHTVSRDGRHMAAKLWGGTGPGTVFDLAEDLSTDPAPTAVPPGTYEAVFSTFNPDASRLLVNTKNKLTLLDPTDGSVVPTGGTPLPTTGTAQPIWSPDGSMIAYVTYEQSFPGVTPTDFVRSDLGVIPVTGPDTFGDSVALRLAENKANVWPTFSPDSEWIAYGRGKSSRGSLKGANLAGDLRLIHRDGGDERVLANASGDEGKSHLPNFSPFDEGGYFWLAFYSTRDYGNAQAGTRGTGRRQLWVSAISSDPQGDEDPSHIPYWLPDQDSETDNMSAFWALPPPVVVE